MNKTLLFILGGLLLVAAQGIARDYGLVEKPGNTIPDDVYVFFNESNRQPLTGLIDKPTLITFTFFHCNGLCPKWHEGIAEIIDQSDKVLGIDYQVISVSIDTSDKIEYAFVMKDSLIRQYGIPEAGTEWHMFLTDEKSLQKLTNSVGYKFATEKNAFIHPVVSVLVTPNKMISQYFYGTFFMPWHFDQSIEQAANEQTSPPRVKNLKYCHNFEYNENKMVRQIAIFSGIAVLMGVLAFYIYLLVTGRRKNRA